MARVGDTFIFSDRVLTIEVTVEAISSKRQPTLVSWKVLFGPPVLMVVAVAVQGVMMCTTIDPAVP